MRSVLLMRHFTTFGFAQMDTCGFVIGFGSRPLVFGFSCS